MRGLYSVHSQEVLPRPRRVLKFRQPARIRAAIRLDLARDCPRTASECSSGGRAGVGQVGAWYRLNPPPVCQSCDSRFPDRIPPAGSAKAVHASRIARAAAPSDRTQIRQLGARHLCGPGRSRLSILPLAMALCTPQWPLVAFGLRRTAAQRSRGRCRCP